MANILVLVGTESGNAQMVADTLKPVLGTAGHYQDTYCGGGKNVDRVLELCGARKLGARLEVDASSQPLPDEEALGWVEDWKSLV